MTGWRKRQVMEMAREAGLRSAVLLHMYGKENALCDSEIEELRQLERFAELVRADERELCARVCDELPAPDIYNDTDKSMWDVTCMDCATAIRAREDKHD